MKKAILFEFNTKENNNKKYIEAIALAKALNATLVCFTTLEEEATVMDEKEVYLHLLELKGFYQTHINQWSSQVDIDERRIIGIEGEDLSNFIDKDQYQFIPIAKNKNWYA